MAEYIEREAFLADLEENYMHKARDTCAGAALKHIYAMCFRVTKETIEKAPAADVVPMDFHERCLEIEIKKRIAIERKQSEWVERAYGEWFCKECGYEISGCECHPTVVSHNFCPNCGADMREVREDG